MKDFEERRVPVDVRAAIFDRACGVTVVIRAQQNIYGPLGAGQVDGQTLKSGGKNDSINLNHALKTRIKTAF